MLNRSVVIVRARSPFREWLNGLPDPAHYSLDAINEDSNVYLLPSYDYDEERDALLEHYFDIIFEEQLSAWCTDKRDWPEVRGFPMFLEWFDIEFHSSIDDLVDEPLEDVE